MKILIIVATAMRAWTIRLFSLGTFLLAIAFNGAFAYEEGLVLTVVSVESECPNGVTLSWTGTAQIGYNVYRTSSAVGKKFIGSATTVNKITDNTVSAGHTYIYWIEEVNNSSSTIAAFQAIVVPYTATAPSSPLAALINGDINVSWSYYFRVFTGEQYSTEAATVLEEFRQNNGLNGLSGLVQKQLQDLTDAFNTYTPAGLQGILIYRSKDLEQYSLVKTITGSSISNWLDTSVQANHSYSYFRSFRHFRVNSTMIYTHMHERYQTLRGGLGAFCPLESYQC
jgi:hypothetical protein